MPLVPPAGAWRALWCPGAVVAIHKKPTLSNALAGSFMSKTCDLVAGCYRYDGAAALCEQPVRLRRRIDPLTDEAAAPLSAAAALPQPLLQKVVGLATDGSSAGAPLVQGDSGG